MTGGPPTQWDDDEDDSAFDEASVLDAFAAYAPADGEFTWETMPADDDGVLTVVFTASNPAGTVSVTALMDGKIFRIDLDPKATMMTEQELAQEITVVARLARRQAQAGQHLVIAALMQRLGRDPADTRSFLERELQLPAPDVVMAERAELYAAHYSNPAEDSTR